MKKPYLLIGAVVVAVAAIWFFMRRASASEPDLEYRYAAVEEGEVVRSISATGTLVALTTVDVKSKAGGKIIRLAVDEGTPVRRGDLIAEIDPSDTRAVYDQASADLVSARARAEQAQVAASLEARNSRTGVANAEQAVALARLRLTRANEEAKAQPTLSAADLRSAEAAVETQRQALRQLTEVTQPQARRDAENTVRRTRTDLDVARAEMERQQGLLGKGYVSQAAFDRARSGFESARAAFDTAQLRLESIDEDNEAALRSAQARLRQAEASLAQARANQNRTTITRTSRDEAVRSLRQAEIALQRARDDQMNITAQRANAKSASAATVRSRVSVENAKVQLESTTVVAPRDGVVTLKYLEEGTIIPPGTSTFAQGTSIVQISDTTRMFVECKVDEADIAQVKEGQSVRIVIEAYPGASLDGVVRRISPAAITEQNLTQIKVRVEVTGRDARAKLLPGMNATCEFLTMVKPKVVYVPMQAIQREGDKTIVKVRTNDPLKPTVREVKTGEQGNDTTEILSGLKPGDEVVIAEINLKLLRETQQKMLEAEEGGGLVGGAGPRDNRRNQQQGRGGAGGARGGSGGGGARGGASGGGSGGGR